MRNLKKHKRQLEKDGKFDEAADYDFFPMTYNLPTEYPTFYEEFKKNANNVWIMKPVLNFFSFDLNPDRLEDLKAKAYFCLIS